MTAPLRPRPREPHPGRVAAIVRARAEKQRQLHIARLKADLLEIRAENVPNDPRLDQALDELTTLTRQEPKP